MSPCAECPNDNDVAAFVDGTLDEWRRRAIVEHMYDCYECVQLVSAVMRAEEERQQQN